MDNNYIFEAIVYKNTLKNIPYNYRVNEVYNTDVIVSAQSEVRTLFKADDYIINKKITYVGEVDKNVYDLFYVNNSTHIGFWGNNVIHYVNNSAPVKIFIKGEFRFHIEFGTKVLSILNDKEDEFSLYYFQNIIRLKINGTLISFLKNIYVTKGEEYLFNHIDKYKEDIIEEINRNVLYSCGIIIDDLNLNFIKENNENVKEKKENV